MKGKDSKSTAGSTGTSGRQNESSRTPGPAGGWMVFLALLVLASSCKDSYTPKPVGYLKIDYPEKNYRLYDGQEFYQFEIPEYATIEQAPGSGAEEGWINVSVPQLNGKIHLSYKAVDGQLNALITDSRELVYKHTVKAQGIEETPFYPRGIRNDLE